MPYELTYLLLVRTSFAAHESDEYNKSTIDKSGWAKEKRIPAGRAGADEDIAQAVLTLAVNQYAYGQVSPAMTYFYSRIDA